VTAGCVVRDTAIVVDSMIFRYCLASRLRRAALRTAAVALLMTACAGGTPPGPPAPVRVPPGTVAVRAGWRATVTLERQDSIVLTLPTGDHQLQRFSRHASFSVAVDSTGRTTIRLDSMRVSPKPATGEANEREAWTTELGETRINGLKVTTGGDEAAELGSVVRYLLPRLPAAGVHPPATWQDSAEGNVRVDIFSASEHRVADWTASAAADHDGTRAASIHLRETFEQIGDGTQGGVKITMTAQGKRSGTYYVSADGRILSAQLSDSMAMLISVPSRKQVVPTTRFSRTTIRFTPAARAPG
jgi:hypothetical protein